MIETDFGWALAKMRDGYKVRRPGWQPGAYWVIADGVIKGLIDTADVGAIDRVHAEHALAYDWELADG